MIDPRYRCIFIHQRKVAGSSIIAAFDWTPRNPEWHCFNDGVLSPEWPTRSLMEKTYFVFSAVRNPFDRFVSGWKYLSAYAERPIVDVLRHLPTTGHDYQHLARPQVNILRDPTTGAIACDAIMRFETLQQDFDGLCDRLGRPRTQLGHYNPSRRHRDYRAYFSPEARALATQVFRDDLEAFGYDF